MFVFRAEAVGARINSAVPAAASERVLTRAVALVTKQAMVARMMKSGVLAVCVRKKRRSLQVRVKLKNH